jgi:excisionase family DNA binding protein
MSSTIHLLDEPLLTAGQIGSLLGGIPSKTVLQYARDGRLPCLRIGKHVRFVRSDIDTCAGPSARWCRHPHLATARTSVRAYASYLICRCPLRSRLRPLGNTTGNNRSKRELQNLALESHGPGGIRTHAERIMSPLL